MKNVYGYIRVSTAKQGEGVSLIEQKDAITRYATQQNLKIVKWFEEKETAAKQGRPLFNAMIKQLKAGKANGVIIHKIDRSARNLSDWAELGDLIDKGIEAHFAHESLDLQARGGRLSADIQAVIASDYIRNLRQEAIKGIYGRLKQGVYPFQAPTGYLDTGAGKFKEIDKVKGPLIRRAFELYATKKYNLNVLISVLHELGLRNLRGGKIDDGSLSRILNNPFYMGIIKVKGKIFKGGHKPLVSPRLFKQVQAVLKGKTNVRLLKHDFLFRKTISCANCGYSLTGEIQKGHVYYRCHTKGCLTKGLRETTIEKLLTNAFEAMELHPKESATLDDLLLKTEISWTNKQQELLRSVQLQKDQLDARLERLTDAFVDGLIDSDTYGKRKEGLLIEQKILESKEKEIASGKEVILKKAKRFLELAKSIKNTYETAISEEKRDFVEIVTSNLSTQGKNLIVATKTPFYELSQRSFLEFGGPERAKPRTYDTKLVYSGNNTCPIIGKSLSESQLKLLLEEILRYVDLLDFKDELDL